MIRSLLRKNSIQKPDSDYRSNVITDKRNYEINALFFQRLWRLTRPYWTRKGSSMSWVILTILFIFVATYSIGGIQMAQLYQDQTNALVAKQTDQYWHLWLLFTGAGLLRFAGSVVQTYLAAWLNLHWRQWLTMYLVDKYLEKKTYYQITLDQQIDNPDQRIQEQVKPFVEGMSQLPQQLLGSTMDMVIQIIILSAISKSMLIGTVIYALIQTVVTLYLYRPTIKQNWESTVAEADLRYGILHVRDNAETIAFYEGESTERNHIEKRTHIVVFKQLVILRYQQVISAVGQISNLVWAAMPMVFIAPLYISGKIEYGAIMQGVISASLILQSLSLLMNYIPTLSQMAPMTVRLAEIMEKMDSLSQRMKEDSGVPRINYSTGNYISLQQVDLETPGGEQVLLKNISFKLQQGRSLLIMGQTGSGKSSLLRAMAGLWTRGKGEIVMPERNEVFFMPQRPYMVLGTLKDQLTYPKKNLHFDDDSLHDVLEQVGLPDLLKKQGGLESYKDWSRILSLGEQQRIGFARVLLSKPKFLLLDEATSAVDMDMEQRLYSLLAINNITYVSVGHRPSLLEYHDFLLSVENGHADLESLKPSEKLVNS